MPSGPKKRRAARKKNDSHSTISIHPNENVVVGVEMSVNGLNANAVSEKKNKFELADQITSEPALMDKLLPSDQIIVESSLIDLNSKKKEVTAEDDETMCSKEVIEDPYLVLPDPTLLKYSDLLQAGLDSGNANEKGKSSKEHESSFNETPEASVGLSFVDHNKKLLEAMLRILTEMRLNAETQASFAKQLIFNISQILEQDNTDKRI